MPAKRLLRGWVVALILGWAALSPHQAAAQGAAKPQVVKVGVFVVNISELDLKAGTYVVDCYVWFLWKGKLSPSSFEIMNGSETTKERNFYQSYGNLKYAVYRCRSTLSSSFDFTAYPLDRHTLNMHIEDAQYDERELVYEADRANSKMAPEVSLSGWQVEPLLGTVRTWVYPTTYGDPTLTAGHESRYSRLVVDIPIHHSSWAIYLKSFLALFISVGIAFLAVFIYPSELEARLGLGVAAVFGAVSSQILIAQNLPETPAFTLADRIHIAAYFFIFLALTISVFAYYLCEKRDKAEVAVRCDRWSRILLPAGFALVVTLLTLLI